MQNQPHLELGLLDRAWNHLSSWFSGVNQIVDSQRVLKQLAQPNYPTELTKDPIKQENPLRSRICSFVKKMPRGTKNSNTLTVHLLWSGARS